MKYLQRFSYVLIIIAILSCSLPPDVPVTKEALDNAKLYERFVIEESPETLIHVLNKKGEMVVRATYRNTPIYIKIFATSRGLLWYAYPR